jgi:hypothetical protein
MNLIAHITRSIGGFRVNLGRRREGRNQTDLIQKIDQLARAQNSFNDALNKMASAQADINRLVSEVKAEVSTELERSRSSAFKWIIALALLPISGLLIFWGQSEISNISTIDGQTTNYYQQAESGRSQALEGILGALPAFDGSVVITATSHKSFPFTAATSMLKVIGDAQNELSIADKIDSEAYRLSASTSSDSYFAGISITLGSVIASCAVGWIIAQNLPAGRKRKHLQKR